MDTLIFQRQRFTQPFERVILRSGTLGVFGLVFERHLDHCKEAVEVPAVERDRPELTYRSIFPSKPYDSAMR